MHFSKLPIAVLITVGFAGLSTASILDAREFSGFDFALEKRQQKGGNNNKGGKQNAGQQNAGQQNAGQQNAGQQNGGQQNGGQNGGADFCQGKTLTGGKQVKGGSCNDIVMGNIPSNKKMPSTVILSPQPGEDIAADKTFTVSLQVANLQAGSFSDADAQYYSQPQDLNGQGEIIGHTHVTIQDMQGSLTPAAPLDASKFSFFKGINDAGDGNGGLKAVVTGGLAAGFYRVCTMSSATTHQPVIMPVAQRGTQDDCTKFTVGQGNAKGQQANGQQANGQQANGQQANGQQNKGQQAANGKNQGGKKKAAREFQA